MEKLRARLRRIEEEIEERNKGLAIPYTVLLPSRVPAGTAVWWTSCFQKHTQGDKPELSLFWLYLVILWPTCFVVFLNYSQTPKLARSCKTIFFGSSAVSKLHQQNWGQLVKPWVSSLLNFYILLAIHCLIYDLIFLSPPICWIVCCPPRAVRGNWFISGRIFPPWTGGLCSGWYWHDTARGGSYGQGQSSTYANWLLTVYYS